MFRDFFPALRLLFALCDFGTLLLFQVGEKVPELLSAPLKNCVVNVHSLAQLSLTAKN